MPAPAYTATRFKLRAVINGVEFPDVVQIQATFELNNIPSASLLVAVGRNVQTNLAATIHNSLGKLRMKVPAQVYLQVISVNAGDGTIWPAEEFLIFEGYAVGSGWQRTSDEAQYVIHLLHWLDDLNCSSSLSATCHPTAAADLTYSAVVSNLMLGDPGTEEPIGIPICDAARDITLADIQDDLWGNILLPWLKVLAAQDRVDQQILGGRGVTSKRSNKQALKALARMTPPTADEAAAGGCQYVPLAVDTEGANGDAIGRGVRTALTRDSLLHNWLYTTLWGKLVGHWSPNYFFAVAPQITSARIVASNIPLQDPIFKTIKAAEYNYSQLAAQMPQVLQAVGIFHSVRLETGSDLNAGSHAIGFRDIAGWYEPAIEEGEEVGMILTKDPPDWLTEVTCEVEAARDASGATWAVQRTAYNDGGKPLSQQPPQDAVEQARHFLNRYAHHWYAIEMLKGRQGELSGKLRFDIAPGSNIKIDSREEPFIPGDKLADSIYATVTRVTYLINSEQQQAGTSFSLAHVRTEAENKNPRTSEPRPPLYTKAWAGCALHDLF